MKIYKISDSQYGKKFQGRSGSEKKNWPTPCPKFIPAHQCVLKKHGNEHNLKLHDG